jgi:malate synthase
MAVPFMRSYAELLVHTCHRRGAHAIGGMAAFIPSRRDPAVNEIALAKVREDKQRESSQGFDGTWVAHPDLVPVAFESFERENQLDVLREDVQPDAAALNGVGAAAISNLMEDAATAEISRSQVWQWLLHGRFAREDVQRVIAEEMEKLGEVPRVDEARALFEAGIFADEFVEFLTVPAYEHID